MLKIRSKRNSKVFSTNKKTLACYVLAGYPDEEAFFDVLKACNDSCFDILEIGFPSFSPYLDGVVIRDAHSKVNKDVCTKEAYWKRIRSATDKPIWVMGYHSDLKNSGIYQALYKDDLIDAYVIPDITNEERKKLYLESDSSYFDFVGFTNPDMEESELVDVFETFPIVYEQLYVGQTGAVAEKEVYHPMLELSNKYPDKNGLAGFGISKREQIEKLYNEGFEGAIVGTGIIRHLNESLSKMEEYMKELGGAKEKWQ